MVYRFSFLRLLYYFYKRHMAYGHMALFHLFQPLIKAFASYDVLVVFISASKCPRGEIVENNGKEITEEEMGKEGLVKGE